MGWNGWDEMTARSFGLLRLGARIESALTSRTTRRRWLGGDELKDE